MNTRADELMSTLREQLKAIKQDLDAEREQRQKVQKELTEYKAYMNEPFYENETSPVPSDDQALPGIPEDRPNLSPLPGGANLPSVDNFQFVSGMPVSGSVGQWLSVPNQPSTSYVGNSTAGASGNPVPSAGNLGMQGQGSQLPGGLGMPPVFPPSASFGAGGFGGPNLQGPVFHVTIKPREPPVFCSKTNEDVETWIFTVSAYFRTVAAPEEQKVGYALTFLQDATREWWINTIRTTGYEPQTWNQLAVALREIWTPDEGNDGTC